MVGTGSDLPRRCGATRDEKRELACKGRLEIMNALVVPWIYRSRTVPPTFFDTRRLMNLLTNIPGIGP